MILIRILIWQFLLDAGGYEGLKIYENVGNTVFIYFYHYYIHSLPRKSLCTDFNNDGYLDLAITYGYGQRIGIYWGQWNSFIQ